MNSSFDFRIEWLEAPGVTTPELAATWARYEIWVGDRCVTQVETVDGTFRRGVYGSLYPLAHWIASNWWLLSSHVRPSAVDMRYWTWQNDRTYPWLRQHNLRGAGDGMAWPDLTLVPEGSVTRIVWSHDDQRHLAPVRFAADGSGVVQADEIAGELAGFVNRVLERLTETGLPKTPLAEEWDMIAQADSEEKAFCQTAARLGLDPYSVTDNMAETITRAARDIPADVVDDFFDSADVAALDDAVAWALKAMPVAGRAAGKASRSLRRVREAALANPVGLTDVVNDERPWILGYSLAHQLRRELSLLETDQFDVAPWVGIRNVNAPSHGIYGFAVVRDDRCGVVLGSQGVGLNTRRFAQARALGRILAHPERHQFILSAAHSQEERMARAFAAELLAPAAGIRQTLESIGREDDSALEVVAERFRVSPLVVRHQYDNQIAASSRNPLPY